MSLDHLVVFENHHPEVIEEWRKLLPYTKSGKLSAIRIAVAKFVHDHPETAREFDTPVPIGVDESDFLEV